MATRSSSTTRTAHYRANLRRRGLRPVQIWVPDTRAPGFAAEARRQCAQVNQTDRAERLMEWVEQVSMFDDDDAR
jgi:hypothetical protein